MKTQPKVYRWESAFAEQINRGTITLSAAVSKASSNIVLPNQIIPQPLNLSASLAEIEDLYPIETILMTAGLGTVNKNDVMFLIEDTVAAKDTPVNKPLNMNHEDVDIVGHITGSCLVDDEFNTLTDMAALPDKLHVKTSAVVYKHWRNKNRRELVDSLIEEIAENKWFVSMECLFSDFDYAVKEKNSVYNIVQRNDDTSYLTKYLKCFGGVGECDGCRVIMVPRNFIFSGKGFTKNPANVESVIINKATFIPNDIAEVPVKIETVELSQKLNSINDKRVNKMDLEKLVAELKLEVETEKAKAVKADVLRAENDEKITKLQQTVADLTAADKVKDELAAKLKNDITELVAEKTKLEKTVADLQIEKLETDRVTTLVSAGLDKADATKFVKTFANVSDEQFAELVAIKVESSVKPKVEEMPKEGVAKTAPTPKPELELEASTTPHLSTDHTKTTHEVLSAAKGYFNSRKILGK